MRMRMISKHRRCLAVQGALGSLRLEALVPSKDLLEDLDSWADGKLPLEEVRRRMLARFAEERSLLRTRQDS